MAPEGVTLAGVAARAGVSITTVSKVLNGRGDVASPTRRRVEDALLDAGYLRSPAEGEVIELVLAGQFEGPAAALLVAGALKGASRAGLRLVLTRIDDGAPEGWLEGIIRRGPAAVLLGCSATAREIARLRMRGIPVVRVGPVAAGAGAAMVAASDRAGGAVGADHLLHLGHHRISVVADAADADRARRRIGGARASASTRGVVIPDRWVGTPGRADVGAYIAGLLGADPRPSAVLVVSDLAGVDVLRAISARGLAVPGDVSLVAYDDGRLTRLALPRATVVRHPLDALGLEAVRTAVRMLAQPEARPLTVELSPTIAPGWSTAAIAD
ncbi:LacI family DNA-binding transcriptional regulator [Microbacterium insulae]|uniref:LacI family DNA-binding transcriptional regulator n=1 Tax=Microbacterium insulae TaxID=483014 RepID=A0ABW3AH69_9MICO